MPIYYQVGRVPSFVINRRFKIEVASATPANVQQVLSVAAALAAGTGRQER